MVGIVYIYTFPNGKKYIGQTVQTLAQRARLGLGYKHSPLVYAAIQKYGWDNIQKEIFECQSREEMDALEISFIDKYQTTKKEFGYNLESGGNKNKVLSEETKHKISQSHMGMKPSEETRKKLSEAHKGKHLSEETKKKLSEINRGENHPQYGTHRSETTIKKLRENASCNRAVICLETKEVFISAAEAARQVELKSRANINHVCNKLPHCKTAGGYHWMWFEDYQKEENLS